MALAVAALFVAKLFVGVAMSATPVAIAPPDPARSEKLVKSDDTQSQASVRLRLPRMVVLCTALGIRFLANDDSRRDTPTAAKIDCPLCATGNNYALAPETAGDDIVFFTGGDAVIPGDPRFAEFGRSVSPFRGRAPPTLRA